jgi:hypothetical protein
MTNTAIIQSSPIKRRLPPLNRPALLKRSSRRRPSVRGRKRVAAGPAAG